MNATEEKASPQKIKIEFSDNPLDDPGEFP